MLSRLKSDSSSSGHLSGEADVPVDSRWQLSWMTGASMSSDRRKTSPPLLRRVCKPDAVLDLGQVDPVPVQEVLDLLSTKIWEQENARKENNFSCFHHTQHIILRFIHNLKDPRYFYSTPAWSIFQARLLPLMNDIVKPYGFTNPVFPKVMFARLEAGQVIDRHSDGAGANLMTHKIHIPLVTGPEVLFFVNDQPHYLQLGRAYEVNNIARHGVDNPTKYARVHFIFEVFDYPEEQLHETRKFH